ncbi:unnamed protein product, partial [marine sediment metagenome]
MASPQERTRLRIMCREACGFESHLPHCQATSPTDAPLVLVPKFPGHPPVPITNQVDKTPDKSVNIYAGANFPATPREELTGFQIKPPRPPERQGGGGDYMQTEVAVRNFLSHCQAQNLKAATI